MAKNGFIFTLANLLQGQTLVRLGEELDECLHVAKQTGKPTKMSVELTFKPLNQAGQFQVVEKSKKNLPEPERGVTLFWLDDSGDLCSSNPGQRDFLREMEDNVTPLDPTERR